MKKIDNRNRKKWTVDVGQMHIPPAKACSDPRCQVIIKNN